ncbi:peptidoglycan-associated lipoprotein Pal [Methylotetracoccus oryzae]|uniref:peptidoglycan-associated lipoprotein Pal n=1 Tax=Methylotetracoccus oryzae TaxID=1919059 RepID=UPI00111B9CC3|nr:peptidoglycan-associated lipoprotein Pal [Methylotetracoccus oryzae]
MALKFWNGAACLVIIAFQGCSSSGTKPEAAAQSGSGRGGAAQVGRYDPADAAAQGQQRARGAADAAMGYRAPSERVIYFEYDSDDVLPEYVPLINAHAAYLSANPKRVATLEGHADERGSSEYNVGLGEQRARAVARMLGLQGVSEGQLQIVSYGEEKAADLGHDEAAWQRNRRVEINYTGR